MTPEFDDWWDSDLSFTDNPFTDDTPAYWAWEGWQAGVKAEREACAKVSDYYDDVIIAQAIRARSKT